jgi:hypothetical protein
MLLQRSKNAVADLMGMALKAFICQGLQRHPFQRKDIVESMAAGTAKY